MRCTEGLISSFTTIKGSKCQVCVQAKQPRKSHTTAETRNLAPLELIKSDRSHVVLCAKELSGLVGFLRRLGLRL